MNETLKTVLISLGTSLIVSLITFILGLKSGKNQADRSKLQELYKQLYSHFDDLEKSIKENRCKTWEDYERISKGDTIVYTPIVRKLEMSGDLIFLNRKLADHALWLEKEVMNYGAELENASGEIHSELLNHLDLLKEGYQFEENSRNKGQKIYLKSVNPTACNSYRSCTYRDIFCKTRFQKLVLDMENLNTCAVQFQSKGNPPGYSFTLYPGGLAVSTNEFLRILEKSFEEHVKGYANAEEARKSILNDVGKLKRQLYKKAREPISFYETFFGAFADLFR
jgi:hypothetical protein